MTTVQGVLDAAQRLSPVEQLQIIQALSQALQQQYPLGSPVDAIPSTVKRMQPITNLNQLAANFWPEDESADDINDFVAQQRLVDTSMSELLSFPQRTK